MANQLPVVEGLEARNLFSVIPMTPYSHAAARTDSTAVTLSHKSTVATATTTKPVKKPHSVLGLWHGRWTVKGFLFKTKYDLDLEFTSVTKTAAFGTLWIDDVEYHGRWTGTTKTDGGFGYTLRRHGNAITITGQLDGKSNYATGRLKVEWGFSDDKGNYTLKKVV